MKGRWISYSPEELAFIEGRQTMSRRALHADFVRKFGRYDVSLVNLISLCKRRGWLTGRDGRYEKGRVPENKGRKMPYNENSARTRFQKGTINGRARERYKPIGTERRSKEGYVERKVHDGLPRQSRWRFVHLIRWEAANGPLSAGMVLKCLDGDRTNTDPANWTPLPRALLPRLNGRHGRNYDTAPAELKPTIMAVVKLEHRARERSRAGR